MRSYLRGLWSTAYWHAGAPRRWCRARWWDLRDHVHRMQSRSDMVDRRRQADREWEVERDNSQGARQW